MTDAEMLAALATAPELAECAEGWRPEVRLVGNVRADSIALICRALLAAHAEVERMRPVLDGIRDDFDRAIAAHDPSDPRHRSHGGQHTNGRCCTFGNLNPSAIRPMREWIAAIDAARKDTLDRARAAGEGK